MMDKASVFRVERQSRLRFHRKLASVLTISSVVLIVVLALATNGFHFQQKHNNNDTGTFDRRLNDMEKNDANGNDDNSDYTQNSCYELFEITPDRGEAQCQFARTCNQGAGLFWRFTFCSDSLSHLAWFGVLSPVLLIWLILLFRMLGSTAEDYFSPSLEMFSVKLGLPPRFAGVSLLALGNGAADVSATRNAITSDPQKGYLLSLGALTGAAMFIGTVVAGAIILTAQGVPCRGALVRDVTALFITAVVVLWNLRSGTIGQGTITLFFSLYCLFVCIVLVADIYHRAVVVPRQQQVAEEAEVQRQHAESQVVQDAAGDALNHLAQDHASSAAAAPRRGVLNTVITAISNYDNSATQDGWGVESDGIVNERPIVLHGANGVLSPARSQPSVEDDVNPSVGNYAILEDGIDNICADPTTGAFSASNWKGAWHDGLYELQMSVHDCWKEIFDDEEAMIWDKSLAVAEFPFTLLRMLSVPIPCEGYYSRGMVAAAMILSPVWLAFYMWNEHETNFFWSPPIFYFHFGACVVIAALILRFAPGGDGGMNLKVATPIALYGFFIAATWIDWIADHLVSLLEYLGVVCGVPGSVMGLTILAWGNSMADLSANLTMARKGLANMAMTACYAGPVFNILVGLGLGFTSLASQTGNPVASVQLSPSIVTGFAFIMAVTIAIVTVGVFLSKGRIPKKFGYVILVLYFIYVALSVVLQYSQSD